MHSSEKSIYRRDPKEGLQDVEKHRVKYISCLLTASAIVIKFNAKQLDFISIFLRLSWTAEVFWVWVSRFLENLPTRIIPVPGGTILLVMM
jgi:hypothetical protein